MKADGKITKIVEKRRKILTKFAKDNIIKYSES